MELIDVTNKVLFGNNDDEHLFMLKCVCGEEFDAWDFIISIYEDYPKKCLDCGRKFVFRNTIKVYEVTD